METIDILSMTTDELALLLKQYKEPAFRAKQIFTWLHEKGVTSIDEMTNLSKGLRDKMKDECEILLPKELLRQTASDKTIKILYELHDGNTIESVFMCHDYGNSLCVSTQVGCRMGCKFCASTIGGKVRDLSPSEILGQVYQTEKLTGQNVDSIVLMGIGEPFDNYQNVIKFLEILNSPLGKNMSLRHVSLSTCGIVPKIYALADKKLQLTLSISLHAADDVTREKIMPINKAYNIEELMKACNYYFHATHRRISYEYALIEGVNDTIEEAEKLASLLKGQGCHINLIPVNPVMETNMKKTSRIQTEKFRDKLIKEGFSATIRRELGTEIDAACGQLRRKNAEGDAN